ncbi:MULTISPECIES: DUF1156 domain-containing protein [Nostocales]|jgi:adenine-specific DNA methylase|nr:MULTISPECIES: DUF1156 domain-containing protein [Nostocales]MCX5981978.1 DUF1156 domain-containing protein [Nostocales cyanobacterium LacPavin_0920_SED1_MAG_38_18]
MNQAAIEQSFPIQEVSEYSAKEKNIRHGHILPYIFGGQENL